MVVWWFVNQNFMFASNYYNWILHIASSSIWVSKVWNVESFISLVFTPSTSQKLISCDEFPYKIHFTIYPNLTCEHFLKTKT
jgi:hypothetical protein